MLGARNRRRLVIAVVVLVVGGGAVAATKLHGHSTPAKKGGTVGLSYDNGPSLVFGMTKRQVQHITGRPTKSAGSCWYFRPKNGKVGAIPMARTLPAAPQAGYLRLCFEGGLYASAARQVLASEVPQSPFPSRKRAASGAGWTWVTWNQNPERGACHLLSTGCVAR